MLVAKDPEAIRKAFFWSTQSREPKVHYEHKEIGFNYRLSNILAAIGRGQLKVLEERIECRRKIFKRYQDALSGIPGVNFMPELAQGKSNRWLTTLWFDFGKTAARPLAVIQALEQANIEARPLWKPLHRQPLYANAEYYSHRPDFSVCDYLFERGLCLPSGSSLSLADQQRVIEIGRASCRERVLRLV